jgi:hydrogenase/urease accessory protein HupE
LIPVRASLLWIAVAGLMAFGGAAPTTAFAHEIRPGYLELTAREANVWDVLWKVPAKGDLRLGIYVTLPEGCEETTVVARRAGTAHLETWRATCAEGLVGRSIEIEGLALTRTDVLVRVRHADATTQTVRLTPSAPTFEVERAPNQFEVVATYFSLGVEHILLGIDHLLFVLALLLLVADTRKLVGAITAFTASHSLTLAAATLGWVRVPSAPVEAAIALSIVFVAAEVVRGSNGLARRMPWLVAFAFGLLHGFGFAGALSDIGLPSHAIPVALALFNVGVEVGQLCFIAVALGALRLAAIASGARADSFAVAARVASPACYAIGTLGAFWLIERTTSF